METTMKTIEEIILISRPNLKPNSVKQYAIHIKKLMRLFETADYSFLENPDDVMSKLEDRHYTSKRNTLNAIIVFLTGEDSSDTREAIKTYQKIRDELNAQYNEEQLSGKISEKQKDNFCELSEIQGMVDEMAKHIQERDIRGRALKTGLSQKDRELLIVWVIIERGLRTSVQ